MIDSAKSSMVYGITKGLSTPERAVSAVFPQFLYLVTQIFEGLNVIY